MLHTAAWTTFWPSCIGLQVVRPRLWNPESGSFFGTQKWQPTECLQQQQHPQYGFRTPSILSFNFSNKRQSRNLVERRERPHYSPVSVTLTRRLLKQFLFQPNFLKKILSSYKIKKLNFCLKKSLNRKRFNRESNSISQFVGRSRFAQRTSHLQWNSKTSEYSV